MRLRAWLGLAVGTVCVGAVDAQFASDRNPPPFGGASAPAATKPSAAPPKAPALPGGLEPVGFTAPATTKPAAWTLPGGVNLPSANQEKPKQVPTTIKDDAQTHPWAVKAELGEWMICVKSYTGAESRSQAEKLAQDLRVNHKIAAYVYERNSADRMAELARIKSIRDDQNAKAQPFLNAMQQAEKEAKANGMTFIGDSKKTMIKVPQPYHETPEQWAVLIGAFKTMDDAGKGLVSVKKLPMPKDESLCDKEIVGGEVKDPKSGKMEWKSALNPINPYSMAFVARNPALTPNGSLKEDRKLDAFEVELNSEVKHCLLNVRKPFTIMVKAYTTPTKNVGDGATTSVFTKAKGSSTADILKATAAEAESLCAALRDSGMKPRTYESYLFHHRNGSIVCVGQFDAADDPALLSLQLELQGITFAMQDEKKKPLLDRDGKPTVQRLFDSVHPFPVPKK